MSKGDLIITEGGLMLPGSMKQRLKGDGLNGISIREAPELAEQVLDKETNSLNDDAVFVPMGDRVLCRRIDEAVRTVGGVRLPDTGKTPAAFGVVVGVGQGRYNLVGQLIPIRVQVGAVIMFGKYAGTDIEIFGVGAKDGKCVSLREEEIMGVIMSKEDYDRVQKEADPELVGVTK
jgi:chaperonin GroES